MRRVSRFYLTTTNQTELNMKTLKYILPAVALLGMVMFTACGGDDDNGGTPPTDPDPGTPASTLHLLRDRKLS